MHHIIFRPGPLGNVAKTFLGCKHTLNMHTCGFLHLFEMCFLCVFVPPGGTWQLWSKRPGRVSWCRHPGGEGIKTSPRLLLLTLLPLFKKLLMCDLPGGPGPERNQRSDWTAWCYRTFRTKGWCFSSHTRLL